MPPSIFGAAKREQILTRALRECLFLLCEQAGEEGRWRLKAMLRDLDDRAPGAWVIDELRSLRPWLKPRPVDHSRDAADAVSALVQALDTVRREEPELQVAIADLAPFVGTTLDPKSARRLARKARELRGFAVRSQQEAQARKAQQAVSAAALGDALSRLQGRLERGDALEGAERAMLQRDLEEARLAMRELAGVLEQEEAPENEGGQVLELVG